MEVDHNINAYAVFQEVTLATALEQIDANGCQIIFTIDAAGRLTGVMSDGDFRRWLLANRKIDTNLPVSLVAKKTVVTGRIDGTREEWSKLFSERIRVLPLVDDDGQLRAVLHMRKQSLRIGKHQVGSDLPTLVVAEIGNNHNGSLDLGRQLIDQAKSAGADCIKFQMRQLHSTYRYGANAMAAEDLSVEYTLDILKRYSLPIDKLFRLFDYCHACGIEPLCTPWDIESVAALESYGINAYKVASPDLTNHDLLRQIIDTGKPMIVSTGMSDESEIHESVALLRHHGASFALLHCNSTYPAPYHDINLAYLEKLREIGRCPVGYSGHERGTNIAIAAVARGAKIIEKHFTLDRSFEGSDHKVSLLPGEFRQMVTGIRQTEAAIGVAETRRLSQGELLNRSNLAKSLVAKRSIRAGEIITSSMLDVKSPGQGLQPNSRGKVIGRRTKRDIPIGQFIFPHDIDDNLSAPRQYAFSRPWGIPVRYHDWRRLTEKSNPNLLEFHLSYRDLDTDFRTSFDGPLDLGFVVHCPELFTGDHILDLCAPSDAYRRRSVEYAQRVLDLAKSLKSIFVKVERPQVVVNLGGFSEENHLDKSETARRLDALRCSLDALDTGDVELLPQTMPPFPWHFGGQRFHNVFVDPTEIGALCRERQMRICLDISHAKLACAKLGTTLDAYVAELAPHIAHLHIADASGMDREGQQIGDGSINFPRLARQLNQLTPGASFIPEIWQGHVDDGRGFWTALDRLEPLFRITSSGHHTPRARKVAKLRRSQPQMRRVRSQTNS